MCHLQLLIKNFPSGSKARGARFKLSLEISDFSCELFHFHSKIGNDLLLFPQVFVFLIQASNKNDNENGFIFNFFYLSFLFFISSSSLAIFAFSSLMILSLSAS